MAQTTLLVAFGIKPGRSEDFKAAADTLFAKVQATEPETLRYEYYLAEDGASCVSIEVFEDPEAFIFHHQNVSAEAEVLFDTMDDFSITVIGATSEAMRAKLAAVEARYTERLGGVAR